jgi:hypothetical protein
MRVVMRIYSKRAGIPTVRPKRQPARRVQLKARQGKKKGNAGNVMSAQSFQGFVLNLKL